MEAVLKSVPSLATAKEPIAELQDFRAELYACLTGRGDALFELADAVLCADGPVRTLVDLALAPEHRRGHGALYGGPYKGRIDVERLRRAVAGMPLPKAADGRIVLAVDVSPWLRPDAATCPDRSFCHTYRRGTAKHQMMLGCPYSVVAALETGRTSWTALLDAIRLKPARTWRPSPPPSSARSSNDSLQRASGTRAIRRSSSCSTPATTPRASPTCSAVCRSRFSGVRARTG